uniref:Uncharacterized protein n=1 Tax=Anguilla anguilla TaxID=7936 RepID=A0A0E9PX50_ANGAN
MPRSSPTASVITALFCSSLDLA